MVNRFPLWIFPALFFAVLINGLLFLLLPLLTETRIPTLDMTEPLAVNLVRVREKEPPPREKEEIKEPKREEPREVLEIFQPELVRPQLEKPDMPAVSFKMNTKLVGATDLGIKMIYSVGDLDQPPRPIVNPDPDYPFKADRMGIEGYVKVNFLVDAQGRVSNIKILEASPEGVFEKSVHDKLRLWRFAPGEILGEPVTCEVDTTFWFKD